MSKEYKGLLVNYDVILQADPDIKYLYELSERDIALLLSQLTYLRWPTRYENLTASKQELDRLIGSLEHKLMEQANCMIDCNEVEDCLDTSPTINTIETNVTNVTNSVTVVQNDITNIQNEIIETEQTDGNLYPDYPDMEIVPDEACGAANYLVVKCREFISDMETATGTYGTLLEAIEAYLSGVVNLIFSPFYVLMAAIFSGAPPVSVLADYDNQTDDMIEYLYCNGFSKSAFEAYVRTLTNGDAIADFIACIGLGSWEKWIFIGSADLTQECSCGLPYYEIYYNFSDGNAVPPCTYYEGQYINPYWHGQNLSNERLVYLGFSFSQEQYHDSIEVEYKHTGSSAGTGKDLVIQGIGTFPMTYSTAITIEEYQLGAKVGGITKFRGTSNRLTYSTNIDVYSVRWKGHGYVPANIVPYMITGVPE